MAGIRVRYLYRIQIARDRRACHGRQIAVLPGHRAPRHDAHHGLEFVQLILRAGNLSQVAVDHRDARHEHVTQVGDDILPGHGLAHRYVGAGRRISIHFIRQLLDANSRLGSPAQVVAGIAGAHLQAARWFAYHSAHVGIGTCDGRSRDLTGHHQRRIEGRHGAIHSTQLIVRHCNLAQGDVTGVGHDVGPGHDLPGIDGGPRFLISIPSVGVLLDFNGRGDAKVVAVIAGRHLRANWRVAGHLCRVGILAKRGYACLLAGHRLVGRQHRSWTLDGAQVVIYHQQPGQRDIARVGNRVGPGYRAAFPDIGSGRLIGVLTVGALCQGHRRRYAKVMARIRLDQCPQLARRIGRNRALVRVLPAHGHIRCRAGHALAGVQRVLRTVDGVDQVVGDRNLG